MGLQHEQSIGNMLKRTITKYPTTSAALLGAFTGGLVGNVASRATGMNLTTDGALIGAKAGVGFGLLTHIHRELNRRGKKDPSVYKSSILAKTPMTHRVVDEATGGALLRDHKPPAVGYHERFSDKPFMVRYAPVLAPAAGMLTGATIGALTNRDSRLTGARRLATVGSLIGTAFGVNAYQNALQADEKLPKVKPTALKLM